MSTPKHWNFSTYLNITHIYILYLRLNLNFIFEVKFIYLPMLTNSWARHVDCCGLTGWVWTGSTVVYSVRVFLKCCDFIGIKSAQQVASAQPLLMNQMNSFSVGHVNYTMHNKKHTMAWDQFFNFEANLKTLTYFKINMVIRTWTHGLHVLNTV